MSKYVAKYMNIEKSKQPTFWNGGSTTEIFFFVSNWFFMPRLVLSAD